MKEINLKIGGLWAYITIVVVVTMICGTAVFVSIQYSQTQKDIANISAQANKDSAKQISNGLGDIGAGICQARDNNSFRIC